MMASTLATVRSLDGWRGRSRPPHAEHRVQFYDDESFLSAAVTDFIANGLEGGEPVVVIATEAHRQAFRAALGSMGVEVEGAEASGALTLCDARSTLDTFMVGGMPDWDRFRLHVGSVLEKSLQRADATRVRAYGEMVDLLWREGNAQAAIRLEELWNDLAGLKPFSLLCAYVMGNFFREAHAGDLEQICAAHAHVFPTETYQQSGDSDGRLREVARLQQRARALEHEVEQRKQLEKELREALSQRKRAEEALRASQQDLVDFLENAVEGLHWVGPDGTILWANGAELAMFGYSKDEYVGRNIARFHADPEVIADILGRLGRQETIKDYQARVRCKDGSIKHVLIHSNALFREGRFIHTRCFTRDVTDRKLLEEELRRRNEDLTRTLRFSDLFVGILGHDLRNPLSAIITGAALLARRADSDRVAKPATRIVNSATRMGRMIDQLLDFTRVRVGKGIPLARRQIDLAEVCRVAIDELDSADVPRVMLEASGDVVGHWDGDRLTQLVSNLLGNALAHGSKDAPVTIRLDGTVDATVSVAVENGGTINADLLPLIFEPFRSSANQKQAGSSGLGLGLYISQQIVLAHSGTIEASSRVERTLFTVRLPRNGAR
jgi:PAS domain S-box-containing protein